MKVASPMILYLYCFDMLFTYKQIQDKFPALIKQWYDKYDLLRPAFNLVFEQFYKGWQKGIDMVKIYNGWGVHHLSNNNPERAIMYLQEAIQRYSTSSHWRTAAMLRLWPALLDTLMALQR